MDAQETVVLEKKHPLKLTDIKKKAVPQFLILYSFRNIINFFSCNQKNNRKVLNRNLIS